jgi:hypothetical protein
VFAFWVFLTLEVYFEFAIVIASCIGELDEVLMVVLMVVFDQTH